MSSRMSTAVLEGCGLQDWIAVDESSYLELAVEQAANLQHLRANPELLAGKNYKAVPLGDAADLMNHLECVYCYGEIKGQLWLICCLKYS